MRSDPLIQFPHNLGVGPGKVFGLFGVGGEVEQLPCSVEFVAHEFPVALPHGLADRLVLVEEVLTIPLPIEITRRTLDGFAEQFGGEGDAVDIGGYSGLGACDLGEGRHKIREIDDPVAGRPG